MTEYWLWLAKGLQGLVGMMRVAKQEMKPSPEALELLRKYHEELRRLIED